MELPSFETTVAIVSIVIPTAAFVWEFAVVGRKRLGYRVQMDALAADVTHSPYAEVLQNMQENGTRLTDPSFVLLRIENAGWAEILADDYMTPANDPSGIRVTFRGRRVVGLVVTYLSQPELQDFFTEPSEGQAGFAIDDETDAGVIRLPKAMLNSRAHYKVLAVLERRSGDQRETFPAPEFRGDVSGRRITWIDRVAGYFRFKMARTESHTFASPAARLGIALLALGVLAQSLLVFLRAAPPPLDCADGTLRLHGSTALAPAIRAVAEDYLDRCEGAGVAIPLEDDTFDGSTNGVNALEKAGQDAKVPVGDGLGDHIAFTDGLVSDGHPRLIPQPVAISVFTLVVTKDAGVETLNVEQIQRIYSGEFTSWSQVGGNKIPIHLISRDSNSGTRSALVERVLEGRQHRQFTVTDCAALKDDEYGRCEVDSTSTLLDRIAHTTGGLGYSEASRVDDHETGGDLVKLKINGKKPTAENVENDSYPYWQTEFAYTYGEAPPGSVAAAFLTFLTQQSGRDILRNHGHGLCSELQDSGQCKPVSTPTS
ncbi:substrate-binding domain-containing protein [Streptomyces sp. NPDC094034]|uniref:substrate-binding domain-containing protein n=1 Tax=Streptomyces sp. NPDC094034 TaxID=3155309 RepID=UPI003317B904